MKIEARRALVATPPEDRLSEYQHGRARSLKDATMFGVCADDGPNVMRQTSILARVWREPREPKPMENPRWLAVGSGFAY